MKLICSVEAKPLPVVGDPLQIVAESGRNTSSYLNLLYYKQYIIIILFNNLFPLHLFK